VTAGKRKPRKDASDDHNTSSDETSRNIKWQTVVVLSVAKAEGRDFLTEVQYLHIVDLIKQLVGFGAKQFKTALTIEKIQEFWELKDKGGVLRKLNVRVYFAHVVERNEIVVLSTYKKEDDGKAPAHILVRLRNRLRAYLAGELAAGKSIYTRN
jgi:hypothetical protein